MAVLWWGLSAKPHLSILSEWGLPAKSHLSVLSEWGLSAKPHLLSHRCDSSFHDLLFGPFVWPRDLVTCLL